MTWLKKKAISAIKTLLKRTATIFSGIECYVLILTISAAVIFTFFSFNLDKCVLCF